MDSVLIWVIIVLFTGHYGFLFYADSLSKRLTREAGVKGWFYQRIRWLRKHMIDMPNESKAAAERAVIAYWLAVLCVALMLLVGISGWLW